MSNSFAVVFTYSFADDVAVYLFDTEDDAKKFLLEAYREELRIDTEENNFELYGSITGDGRYAKIVNHFADHDDITEMHLGNVYR